MPPLPEHVEAIQNFPVPENIADVRSYWVLVNQVSHYYATQLHLATVVPEYPFQHVCIDHLTLEGESYGVFVDRYRGWPGVIKDTLAMDVVTFIAILCEDYGVLGPSQQMVDQI